MARLPVPLVLLLSSALVACDAEPGTDAGASDAGEATDGGGAASDAGEATDGGAGADAAAPDGCVPTPCAAAGAECGDLDDGCGGSVDCGGCPTAHACGRDEANRCAPPGAGATLPCPAGGVLVARGDGLDALRSAGDGDVICVEGPHHAASPVPLRSGVTVIGVSPDAAIRGSTPLSPWRRHADGVWIYDGPLADRSPTQVDRGIGSGISYGHSRYADDVFIDEMRMLRVMALDQLGDGALPAGQAENDAERGRFFFDYGGAVTGTPAIFVDEDPSGAELELAVLDVVLDGSGARDVTLRNLTVERSRGDVLDSQNGDGWLLDGCTFRHGHLFGIRGMRGTEAAPYVLRGSVVHANGQYGIGGNSDGAWIRIESTELSWNNIANYRRPGGYWNAGNVKFHDLHGRADAPALVVRDVDSHHNLGDGFWTDIDNEHVLVEASWFHHNERHGYFHEISCDIVIRDNRVESNGRAIKNPDLAGSSRTAGIFVLDSNRALVEGNVVIDNPNGIFLTWWDDHSNMNSVTCFPTSHDTDNTSSLRDNVVRDNDVVMCEGLSGGLGRGVPVLDARDNAFEGNRYEVPDLAGESWTDGADVDFATWRSTREADATATVGCAP